MLSSQNSAGTRASRLGEHREGMVAFAGAAGLTGRRVKGGFKGTVRHGPAACAGGGGRSRARCGALADRPAGVGEPNAGAGAGAPRAAVDVGHGNTDVTGSGTLAVHAGGCRPPRPARPRPVCGTRTTWRFHPLSWMTLVGSFPAWSWLAERPASG